MRKETITKYFADDGKVFDNEYKCREYECSLYAKDVLFFIFRDGNIERVMNISEAIDCCEIIVVKTIKGAEFVHRCFEDNGLKSPFDKMNKFKTGIFVYNNYKDDLEDDWEDWEECFKRMTEKNEQFMKLLDL